MNIVARVVATCLLSGAIIGILACERESRNLGGVAAGHGPSQAAADPSVVKVSSDVMVDGLAAGGPAEVDGAAVFARVCAACHQATGQGIPGVFPPLDGSSYATGDPERIAAIVFYGLQGPITVKGTEYNSVMAPVGAQMTDEEAAAVISYVRTSWSNSADEITVDVIKKVKEKYGSRGMFQISELGEDS